MEILLLELLYLDGDLRDMYTINIDSITFTWDDNKARANEEKHGVTFEEAATVFDDEEAILFDDPDHSETEDRFLMLGISNRMRLLIVCHCCRRGEIVRIISARKATKNESNQYTLIHKGW